MNMKKILVVGGNKCHVIRMNSQLIFRNILNPSVWGHLNPSSYCDVGRFFSCYLNFELNHAGVY